MTVGLGLGAFVVWTAAMAVVHGALIRKGCEQLDEPVPGWMKAVGVGFAASMGGFLGALPLSCTLGCLVGLFSYPLSMLVQALIGVGASGWVLSQLLDLPLPKALSIQTVWWIGVLAMWAVMWVGLRMGMVWF